MVKCRRAQLQLILLPPPNAKKHKFHSTFAINNATLRDRLLALSAEIYLNYWLLLIIILSWAFYYSDIIINNNDKKINETLFVVSGIYFLIAFIGTRFLFFYFKRKGVFGTILGLALNNQDRTPISLFKYALRVLIKSITLFSAYMIIVFIIGYIIVFDFMFNKVDGITAFLIFILTLGTPNLLYIFSFLIKKEYIPHLFYDKWLNIYVEKTPEPKYGRVFTHSFIIFNVILITIVKFAAPYAQQHRNAKNCIDFFDKQNYQQAITPCLKVNDSTDSEIQWRLGTLYALGNGVIQDYQQAKYYYELSAKQGNSEAQWRLGILYEYGLGVRRDYQQAKYYYELSAKQGNSTAKETLERIERNYYQPKRRGFIN